MNKLLNLYLEDALEGETNLRSWRAYEMGWRLYLLIMMINY
jgi:hypothetical protein